MIFLSSLIEIRDVRYFSNMLFQIASNPNWWLWKLYIYTCIMGKMVCNRHCLPKCLSGSSSLPRDNISRKFMHDHATSWAKYSIICHDTIIKYTISYNSNYCNVSFVDDGTRWNIEIIQITRKMINRSVVIKFMAYCLRITESDTRLWDTVSFRCFLINRNRLSLAFFILSSWCICSFRCISVFFNFRRIWEIERIRLQSPWMVTRLLYGSLSASVIRNYN